MKIWKPRSIHSKYLPPVTQFPALAGPPQRELLAWILVQLLFFTAACMVVQFLGGPALFFSACLLGGPFRGGPARLFFHFNGGWYVFNVQCITIYQWLLPWSSVWRWSISVYFRLLAWWPSSEVVHLSLFSIACLRWSSLEVVRLTRETV